MKQFVLSTMFAQQERFADGAAFARFAAEAGYDAIEISHSTDEVKLRQVVESGFLPVVSLHQPAPLAWTAPGRANSELNLAALEDEERRQAVAHALRTVEVAAEIGARRVVVHLGHVQAEGLGTAMHAVARAYHEGWPAERAAEARAMADGLRVPAAPPHLEAARRSLVELVQRAAPAGVAIGLENRLNFHEIPHPAELPVLLEGVDAEAAGYWHDVGHAEVLARLGYLPRYAWFQGGVPLLGAHVHDVTGLIDHRAPGDGDVEWAYLVEGLRQLDSYTLEINQHQPDSSVRGAPGFLRRAGFE